MLPLNQSIRMLIALYLALYLAIHGYRKKSLNKSGSISAFLVGFISFSVSYRMGFLLILFYYSSSKLTKLKEDVKSKLEDDYKHAGQRNWIQVLTNSVLATILSILYYQLFSEDRLPSMSNFTIESYIWCAYVAHYACANGDTWASELGILSKSKPRLITSFFLREVPPGTNGGMSILGTFASAAGGSFIGLSYYLLGFVFRLEGPNHEQWPMIILGCIYGIIGSIIDSLLGAICQATYYDKDLKCIVKKYNFNNKSIDHISGINLLTNEGVNFFSILITMLISTFLSPYVFKMFLSLY